MPEVRAHRTSFGINTLVLAKASSRPMDVQAASSSGTPGTPRSYPNLPPRPDDVIVPKHRFSGFYDTQLDTILRQRGVDTLIVTGCTTSICVESTIRDAFYRDYRCLLLADCTAEPLGRENARTNHDASLLTIEALFGWVSDSSAFRDAMTANTAASQR